MRVHLGADHAGVHLKDHLADHLRDAGHEVEDHGTHGEAPVDYPDFAASVAHALRADLDAGRTDARGLLVCGSGIGVSIAANRVPGIRAVVAALEAQAELARAHNDANVLCLGARLTAPALAERILRTFLSSEFEGGRHTARVQKIDAHKR